MSDTALQVAMSQQRAKVPDAWQLVFSDWSNEALYGLSVDVLRPISVRAFAGWELDFRNAFGIEVAEAKLKLPWSGAGANEDQRPPSSLAASRR